jgi:hypothetical protein
MAAAALERQLGLTARAIEEIPLCVREMSSDQLEGMIQNGRTTGAD